MKKILVVEGNSAYNVLRRAADEVSKGFEACGYQVDIVDLEAEVAATKLLEHLEKREEYEFYFSIQAIGWNEELGRLPQLCEFPRVGWIVDDPAYHICRLMGSTGKKAHVLMVRDSHVRQIRAEYPKFASVQALYHGGFYVGRGEEYIKRDIDVFFSGTYTPLTESEQHIKEMEGVFGVIADQVKDRIVGKNLASDWRKALGDYLKEIAFEVSEDELIAMSQIMTPLDQYQRDYMREKIIESLLTNGIKVSVVGAGWDKYAGAGRENLEILSDTGVDIDDAIALMQRSKIVLNNTNILDGMHERIFTAMLAGAVCVTNEYELLNDFLENEKELVTFPLNELEELPGIVKNLLECPDKAQAIAEAGYNVALEKHTWQRRGEQIVKWMEDGKSFEY